MFEYLKLSFWRRQGSGGTRKHHPSGDQPGQSQEQEHPAHNAIRNVSAILNFQCMEARRDRDPSRYNEKHDAGSHQSGACGVVRCKSSKPVLQVVAI